MVRPDYDGGSLVNLAASIAAVFGVETGHPPLREPLASEAPVDAVVLVLCDALGEREFAAHLAAGAMPHLERRLLRGEARRSVLTSVFPSTTAAALASLHTGRTPAEHGRLGYSLWLDGEPHPTDMLTARDRITGIPRPIPPGSPSLFQRFAAAGVAGRVVNSAAFATSALSAWLFAGAEYRAWHSAATLPTLVAEAANAPRPAYIHAYWPDHDAVCHVHGPGGPEAADEAAAFDGVVDRLIRRLPPTGRTLLLITGDHGQRQLGPGADIWLDDLGATAPAGERGAAYLRHRPGLAEALAPHAEVVPMAEVWDRGWFGGAPTDPAFRARTGDILAVPREGRSLAWRAFAPAGGIPHRGHHGGWSPEEMLVPLIVLRR